jgi:hypothetical protein
MARVEGLKVEVFANTKPVIQRLMKWTARAGDIRPVAGYLAEYLMRVEAEQFDTEGASSGHPWAGLADATRERKTREGLNPSILRATSALRDALTIPGDKNQKIIINKQTMVFGARGEPEQYGSILMNKPAQDGEPRRAVDLTGENRLVMVEMLKHWISRGHLGMPTR